MNMKDILDFIQELLKHRTIAEIDQDIRLYLHTYFNFEFTIVLAMSNPYLIDETSRVKGQMSNSLKFENFLSELGPEIVSVVRDKIVKQVLLNKQ